MSRLRERLASGVVGTPLQAPAQALRWLKGWPHRIRHPELQETYLEGARIERLLRRTLRRDSTAVDVGGHLGIVVQRLVALAPAGHHHAFEPVPHKARWLQRKFPQVQVHAVALADRDGHAMLTIDRSMSALSGLRTFATRSEHAVRIEVPTRRLDDVLPRTLPIRLLKVDVNGGELGVLRGAVATVRAHAPVLLLELTREGLAAYGTRAEDVLNFLERTLGYRLYLLKDHLDDGPALDLPRFERAMRYPMQAFNFVAARG